jgi:hypothetical protein
MGATGPAGLDYRPAGYVGSDACAECHEELAELHSRTGHALILNKVVDGQPPEYPNSTVSEPPEGYTWDDILYVVGGFAWKAVFIDQSGQIITSTDEVATQFNLANRTLRTDDEWVAFHAGETQDYTCGECHTTGYRPEGHQNDVPGLIGTWAEDGVGCEACHGPGSNHVNDPYAVAMEINRDSEACATCHHLGDMTQIETTEAGFIHSYQQYEELFLSTKRVMNCVDCHNPHAGTRTQEGRGLAIKTECETCHFAQEEYQRINDRRHADCVDCHMPYWSLNAVSDPARYSADVRTHLMAINPLATEQIDRDGLLHPYLTVDAACKSCHNADGRGGELPDERLIEVATGYHDRDLAGSENRRRGNADAEATPTEEAPAEEAPAEEADATPTPAAEEGSATDEAPAGASDAGS